MKIITAPGGDAVSAPHLTPSDVLRPDWNPPQPEAPEREFITDRPPVSRREPTWGTAPMLGGWSSYVDEWEQ